jgi:hypothetical protein
LNKTPYFLLGKTRKISQVAIPPPVGRDQPKHFFNTGRGPRCPSPGSQYRTIWINVSKLMQTAGWAMNRVSPEATTNRNSTGTIAALVLIC